MITNVKQLFYSSDIHVGSLLDHYFINFIARSDTSHCPTHQEGRVGGGDGAVRFNEGRLEGAHLLHGGGSDAVVSVYRLRHSRHLWGGICARK